MDKLMTTMHEEIRRMRDNRELQPQTFTPLGNLILVQPFKVDRSKGGVIIPETASREAYDECPTGLVIACGPDVVAVKRGDVVLIPAHMPMTKCAYKGVEGCILNEGNIMGVDGVVELPDTCGVLEQRKVRALGGEVPSCA